MIGKRKLILGFMGLAALAATALSLGLTGMFSDNAEAQGARAFGPVRYKVTVTNLTRGQIISPSVVATHARNAEPLFTLGSPSSPELAMLAEDAVIDPLIAKLSSDPDVDNVQTIFGAGGPIMPGESASVFVDADNIFREVTVAGMLVTTNDAFFAINGQQGPLISKVVNLWSPAYDSGTEANNEDCMYIPGPPCGNGGVRMTDGAEGYVHVHAGIQGGADLDPAQHDWLNPVASVTIERIGR